MITGLKYPRKGSKLDKVFSKMIEKGSISVDEIFEVLDGKCASARDYKKGMENLGWEFRLRKKFKNTSEWVLEVPEFFTLEQLQNEYRGMR